MKNVRSTGFVSSSQATPTHDKKPTRRAAFGAIVLAVMLVGCGSGDGADTDSAALPLSVEGLLEAEPSGSVDAVGFVVIDSTGARLCFALAESFPPQCGGASVEIANPDVLDVAFEESEAVRWTESAVVVRGQYSEQTFTIE